MCLLPATQRLAAPLVILKSGRVATGTPAKVLARLHLGRVTTVRPPYKPLPPLTENCWVNPTFLFGANDRVPGPGRLIQQLGRSPAVCPFPAGRGRNVAGVGTVCRGVERALRHGVPGECYVLGGVNLSYRTLFQLICGVTASRTRPVPLPGWVIRAAGTAGSAAGRLTGRDPGLSLPLARVACESFHYSSAKAARDLGYLPDDVAGIERAIRASFEWFRRTGRIAPRARGRPPSDAARAVFYDSS